MSYYLWNKLICERFFNVNNEGKRVYLTITEGDLKEITDNNQGLNLGGFDGFIECIINGPGGFPTIYRDDIVNTSLVLFELYESSSNVSSPEEEWNLLFKFRLEYPPFVGYLSFFVLAEFENIDSQSSLAYYDKVEMLLSKHLTQDKLRNKFPNRTIKPLDFLWDALAEWSIKIKGGKFGEFVTHKRSSFRYIFRAKEQALLKYSDRKKLFVELSKRFSQSFLPNMKQIGDAIQELTDSRYKYLFSLENLIDTSEEKRILQKTIYNIIIHDLKTGLFLVSDDSSHQVLHLVPFIIFKDLSGGRITYRIDLHRAQIKEFEIKFKNKIFCIGPSPHNSDWSQPIKSDVELHFDGNDWAQGIEMKVLIKDHSIVWNSSDLRTFSKTIESKKIPGEPFIEVNRLKRGGTYIVATNDRQKYNLLLNSLNNKSICDDYEIEVISINKPQGWDFIRINGIRNNIPNIPDLYIDPIDDFSSDDLDLTIEFSGGIASKLNEYLSIALPSIQIRDFSSRLLDAGGSLNVKLIQGNKEYSLFPKKEHPSVEITDPSYYDDYAEFFIEGVPEEGIRFLVDVGIPIEGEIVSNKKEFATHISDFKAKNNPVGRVNTGKISTGGALRGFDILSLAPEKNHQEFHQLHSQNIVNVNTENLSLDLSSENINYVLEKNEIGTTNNNKMIENKIIELRNKIELLQKRLKDENL